MGIGEASVLYLWVSLMWCSRSVGGVRVSLYNGVTESNVQVLVDYMMEFVELVAT